MKQVSENLISQTALLFGEIAGKPLTSEDASQALEGIQSLLQLLSDWLGERSVPLSSSANQDEASRPITIVNTNSLNEEKQEEV